EAAIAASGIGVRDLDAGDAVVIAPAEASQGLAFQAGEVVAMNELLGQGYRISLADLQALLQQLDPTVFGHAPVAKDLVDGIRKPATDKKSPTRQFWGTFLEQLGLQRADSSNLLKGAPADIELDSVQTMFVLLRLFGDF